MAKDGGILGRPNPAAPIDEEAMFWQSEMGQDAEKLFNDFLAGKKSHEQAYEEFNKKWADKLNNGQVQRPPAQVPYAPVPPVR